MKRLLCFVGLALISQVACAGSWIAYPGDWALWTGNELQARRIEFGGGYPVFWTTYAAHPQIDFKRHVRLAHPVDARIDARGVVIVKGCGPRVGVIDGKYTFPAGEYDVVVRVFNQAHPPSLKIDGSGVDTDGFWNADWRMTETWSKDDLAKVDDLAQRPLSAEVFDREPWLSPLIIEDAAFASVRTEGARLFGDLGKEDFGFLVLKDVCGDGFVRIIYGESEPEARDEDPIHVDAWESVRVASGDVRLKVARGFRYVNVIPGSGVRVGGLGFERETYPVRLVGSFSCSDERVNEIWRVSERTLRLTLREIPVEGIKRDRWTWSGDAVQSFLMNYYLYGERKLVRDALWYLRGGDPVVSHVNTIMDYSFYWFIAIGDYWLHTGDITFLRQVWPRMRSLMDFVESRLDKEGHPHDRPGDWMFIDWAREPLHNYGGVTSFETMLLARAMESMATVGEAVGERPDVTDGYRQRAARLRAWIKPTFWNAEKGALMHLLRDGGTVDPQLTRYPNIFGLMYGYFGPDERRQVVDNVLLNDSVMTLQAPYMRFYELGALCGEGRQTKVLDEIRSYWGSMLEAGATTFWELYNADEKGLDRYAMYGRPYGKSLCHAWGASPVYLLGRHFLGVEPTSPGFKTYTVRPVLGGLEWMRGSVPTPSGSVEVVVSNGVVTVTGNADGVGKLMWKGKETSIPAGQKACLGE